jgi:hypothetical protein
MKRRAIAMSRKRIPRRRRKPRRGPLRCQPYKDWLKLEGKCRACQITCARLSKQPVTWSLWYYRAAFQAGHCDPAHTRNNGMRSKGPDSSCAPLCRGFESPNHHDEYDAGRKAFVAKYGYDPEDEAAAHWTAWQILQEAA